ncbi:homing endonuclease associated repeat-containing protein [Brevibacterium oceani]|uniref:homing endonuclease associated repeat-containing protein n=1 Tax=Brevibacterium oceani TaxID=358099 RepID=UPI0015E6773F|nr:hypothetical protein [Brevibacterium oceani]
MTITSEPAPTKTGAVVFTNQDMLDALRRHARADGALPRNRYRDRRASEEPSAHLFELRFGTWNAALAAAGLRCTPRSPRRDACDPAFSHASMLDAIRSAAADTGSTTIRAYEGWREELADALLVPSAQTIRARFGGWASAAHAAFTDREPHS